MPQTQTAPQTVPPRDTHVYKVVNGLGIEADVIGASAGASKPCVIWIHGGGLIFGSRKTSPRAPLLQALLACDFVIVSIDHRLAPETKLPGIVDDMRDAWRWVHDVGPHRFGIDATRVAMAGGSAGGSLSLLAGTLCEPRPRALAWFWGYGDITAAWEVEASAHYRQMELVTREDADASLGAPPLQDPARVPTDPAFTCIAGSKGNGCRKWSRTIPSRRARGLIAIVRFVTCLRSFRRQCSCTARQTRTCPTRTRQGLLLALPKRVSGTGSFHSQASVTGLQVRGQRRRRAQRWKLPSFCARSCYRLKVSAMVEQRMSCATPAQRVSQSPSVPARTAPPPAMQEPAPAR